MLETYLPPRLAVVGLAALTLGIGAVTNAAILTNLSTVSVIDPLSDAEDVDAAGTGATPEATLEARSDLHVIADVRQGSEIAAGGPNTASFDDTDMPDIAFTFISGQRSTAGNQTNVSSVRTSVGEAMRFLGADGTNDIVFEIDFGSYGIGADLTEGTADDTFDSTVLAVEAAGFTFTNIRIGFTVTAEFFAADDTTSLGTQTIIGADESTNNGIDGYFGLQDTVNLIGLIRVTRIDTDTTITSVADQPYDSGIDDVAFSNAVAIPEPASLALLGLAGLCLLPRRRA